MASTRDFKTLSDREHVLARPGMYLGSTTPVERERWMESGGRFEWRPVKYVPALLKLVDEIIDNSLDAAIEGNFETMRTVSVEMDSSSVTVEDDGPGIPVAPPSTPDPAGRLCPELAWTQMRSGTSFKEGRRGPSANGVGSVCCNIFCREFTGVSDDGSKRVEVRCRDNMASVEAGKPSKSVKHGVRVHMVPDLSRFGVSELDETHRELVRLRLLNLAVCFPKLEFRFNGERVCASARKFASMFSEDALVASSKNAVVAVFPNGAEEFRFHSMVNGLHAARGGSHVDYVANEVCTRVRDRLLRRCKAIRPADVKSRIGMAVMLTDFENPQFDAQTKESLANPQGDTIRHLGGAIDFDDLAARVARCESIVGPVVDAYKVREEMKARSEIKASSKRVRVKGDKYMAAIGRRDYLCLCEGNSAQSGISACLGRKGFGYYAMRGLPINAYSQSMQKISANQEFKEVMGILGLDVTTKGGAAVPDYERVLIATDSDCDGSHITSMLLGWFKRFAPRMFAEGRICKLVTPYVIVRERGRISKYFLNLDDFRRWEAKGARRGAEVLHLKGLGSWEKSDLQELIDREGLERFIVEMRLDDASDSAMEDWLGDDPKPRKERLRKTTFDIGKA